MKRYNSPSEAYLDVLYDVYSNPDNVSSPRGLKVKEKYNYQFTIINPSSDPIVTKDTQRNEIIASYTLKEINLYKSCTNKASDFATASKMWNSIANPDGTINSAYGFLIWANKSHGSAFEQEIIEYNNDVIAPGILFTKNEIKMRTPWEWCLESLKRDKHTRQAVLRFALPEHHWFGNKDFTCTLHGVFSIRNDALDLSIVMRSNDLVLGLVYDLPFFCYLLDKMIEDLSSTYPNLKKGNYTHFVHNIHIYDKDEDKVRNMLGLK